MQLWNYVSQIIFPRNLDFNKATANSILMTNNISLNAIKGIKEISFENKSLSKKNERAATHLQSKSVDRFLYGMDLRHGRIKHSERSLQIQR